MGRSVSFSNENKDIKDIIRIANVSKTSLFNYKNQIIKSITEHEDVPKEFFGYTLQELNDYIMECKEELDMQASLSLLSATEAELRINFWERVQKRKKDELSRIFRAIYQEKGEQIKLDSDLLDKWKEVHPQVKVVIGNFKSALLYRHWLAHGRYWSPKLGREFDIDSVYAICENVIENLINETDSL